ncbi:MAG: murein biosynthesis integral membrane protein MurJ [Candidatus Brocadiia bacterium]
MARLIQRADGEERPHELLFQSVAIGRGRLNDIVIADPGERRVHAEVVALGRGRYAVRDRRSRGGVRVNGQRVAGRCELTDGDVVEVGEAEFVFRAEDEEAAARAGARAGLGSGVARLTAGTLVSRLLGWAREMVALAYFGLSGLFDAYVAATTLPNLLRDVLGEQAAEGAFMPAHRTLVLRGRAGAAARLVRAVLRVVVVAGSLAVIGGMVLAPWLVLGIVPGFASRHPALVDLAAGLARVMMPYLVIIAVGAVFGSLLLSDRRFLRYSLAPAASSLCVIASVVVLYDHLSVVSLAVGLVVGGTMQMLICALPYLRQVLRPREAEADADDGAALRKVGRAVVPIGLAGLLSRVGSIVDRILASLWCSVGSISALYAAFRLMQLPFGVLALAVGRAALPSLVEEASSPEGEGFSRAVVRALRLNAFLMMAATVGLALLARPFVRLMFERGEFGPSDTGMAALALTCYATGLVAMGSRTVLSRAFYALLNTRTPFYLSALGVGANVVLSALLVLTPLEHGGLALATALAAWCQAVLLLVLLRRELVRGGRQLGLAGLWPALGRTAACGAAMAACILGASWALRGAVGTESLGERAVLLAGSGAAGLGGYLAAAVLLGSEEARALLRRGRAD